MKNRASRILFFLISALILLAISFGAYELMVCSFAKEISSGVCFAITIESTAIILFVGVCIEIFGIEYLNFKKKKSTSLIIK